MFSAIVLEWFFLEKTGTAMAVLAVPLPAAGIIITRVSNPRFSDKENAMNTLF